MNKEIKMKQVYAQFVLVLMHLHILCIILWHPTTSVRFIGYFSSVFIVPLARHPFREWNFKRCKRKLFFHCCESCKECSSTLYVREEITPGSCGNQTGWCWVREERELSSFKLRSKFMYKDLSRGIVDSLSVINCFKFSFNYSRVATHSLVSINLSSTRLTGSLSWLEVESNAERCCWALQNLQWSFYHHEPHDCALNYKFLMVIAVSTSFHHRYHNSSSSLQHANKKRDWEVNKLAEWFYK